jgi:multidrug transporter EmrE-like cation transporter
MAYFFLALTILFETTALVCMKLSSGFQHLSWSIVAVTTYILSFVFLTLALKHLPAGVTNAIWAGSSTLLVAIAGAIIFKESLSAVQIFFLLLIIAGIVGLSITEKAA